MATPAFFRGAIWRMKVSVAKCGDTCNRKGRKSVACCCATKQNNKSTCPPTSSLMFARRYDVTQRINAALSKGSRELKLAGSLLTQISELPPDIGALTSLIQLDLSNNALKALPAEFVGLHASLTELNLRNNSIGELPQLLSQFTRLRALNVSQNGLTDSSITILSSLTQLRELQLAHNNITLHDFSSISWYNLETLNLASNKLTTFPSIFHLYNLINLDLSNNQIRIVPSDVSLLPNLKILNLHSNQVVALPNELGLMHSLKKLNVEANPVALSLSPLSAKGNEELLVSFLKTSAGRALPHSSSEGELANLSLDADVDDGRLRAVTPTPASGSTSYFAPPHNTSNDSSNTKKFLMRMFRKGADAAEAPLSKILPALQQYSMPTFTRSTEDGTQKEDSIVNSINSLHSSAIDNSSIDTSSMDNSSTSNSSIDNFSTFEPLSPILYERKRAQSLPHIQAPSGKSSPPPLPMRSVPSSPILTSSMSEEREYTDEEFITKLNQAANLKSSIDSFVARLRQRALDPDDLQEALVDFVGNTMNAVATHPIWRDATPSELLVAKRGLQEYVLGALYDMIFAVKEEDKRRDEEISSCIRRYSFIAPEHLEIEGDYHEMWAGAINILLKINATKSCKLKMKTIPPNMCHYILAYLSKSGTAAGADLLLPNVIYTVLKANPPHLHSNILWMSRYSDSSESETIYYVTQLIAAVHFIETLSAESLKIDPRDFYRLSGVEKVPGPNNRHSRKPSEKHKHGHSHKPDHRNDKHERPERVERHVLHEKNEKQDPQDTQAKPNPAQNEDQVVFIAEMFPHVDPSFIAECLKEASKQRGITSPSIFAGRFERDIA